MRPVMQASLTSDVEAYRASMASILDVDLDALPVFEGLAAEMQWNAWLATEANLVMLSLMPGVISSPPGYWIARVRSPYPGYDVHTVVMAGSMVAHDPHPEPQSYDALDALLWMELLLPMDPSEPGGRFRLVG